MNPFIPPYPVPVGPFGIEDIRPEAVPTSAAEDKQALEERKWLFMRLGTNDGAMIASYLTDILLRFLVAGALCFQTIYWLDYVAHILKKQLELKSKLSDGVLIALLTTTTINVLSLLAAVALYLFPRKKDVQLPLLPGSLPPR